MILFGQGTGLLIEAWKITKAVDIKVVRATSGLLPYKVEFRDKHVLSAEEKATQEYDALAFKWVIWATTPFLLGYAVYSLMYNTHRSWYSFVLTTLTVSRSKAIRNSAKSACSAELCLHGRLHSACTSAHHQRRFIS